MPSQTLTSECAVESTQATGRSTSTISRASQDSNLFSPSFEAAKALYRADQQAKFLHLQAETEFLLRQLQILKQHRSKADE